MEGNQILLKIRLNNNSRKLSSISYLICVVYLQEPKLYFINVNVPVSHNYFVVSQIIGATKTGLIVPVSHNYFVVRRVL